MDELNTTWENPKAKKSLENCIKYLKAASKSFDNLIDEIKKFDEESADLDWASIYYNYENDIEEARHYIDNAIANVSLLQDNGSGENIYTYLTVEYLDDYTDEYTHKDYENDIIKMGLQKIKQETN